MRPTKNWLPRYYRGITTVIPRNYRAIYFYNLIFVFKLIVFDCFGLYFFFHSWRVGLKVHFFRSFRSLFYKFIQSFLETSFRIFPKKFTNFKNFISQFFLQFFFPNVSASNKIGLPRYYRVITTEIPRNYRGNTA